MPGPDGWPQGSVLGLIIPGLNLEYFDQAVPEDILDINWL